ncbi:MAG: c-type cytochrome [Burkholderiales bacterium]
MVFARYAMYSLLLLASFGNAHAQDADKAKLGARVYNNYCSTCHGDNLVSSGNATFDLRRLRVTERTRFDTAVNNGKGQMPPWKGVVSADEIEQIWHYIRQNANDKK